MKKNDPKLLATLKVYNPNLILELRQHQSTGELAYIKIPTKRGRYERTEYFYSFECMHQLQICKKALQIGFAMGVRNEQRKQVEKELSTIGEDALNWANTLPNNEK